MAVAAHLEELTTKHINLDAEIQNELKTPVPDTLRLTALKKQKLHIKEQIAHYSAQ